MKKLILLLFSALLVSCSAAMVTPAPSNFDKAAMDTLLSEAVSSGEVIGVSALVFDEGQTVYKGIFGLGDRERDVPITEDSVFRIYSMTKPITSALIMDLVEEGKLSVDDPVAKYIPQLANMKVVSLGEDGQPKYDDQVTPMTVKDLLLHRAGMAYGIFGEISPVEVAYGQAGLFDPSEDLSVKMDKLSQLPLLAQPGTGWYYSYSIDVLGRIIEVVTEQSLGDAMRERFFDPLGMSETGFKVTPEQKARFVTNYFIQPDGSYVVAEDGQTSPFLADNAFESGGGGLVSTLGDYAKFAEMILNGGEYKGVRILGAETVKMMMTNQMSADDIFMMPWLGGDTGVGFGYGGAVQVSVTPERMLEAGRHPGQWGWGGAARSNMYIDPQNDAFGIIMLQFFGGEDPDIHNRFQALSLAQTDDEAED